MNKPSRAEQAQNTPNVPETQASRRDFLRWSGASVLLALPLLRTTEAKAATARDMGHAAAKQVNLTPAGGGELLAVGATRMLVLEDGSLTDNRFGSVASMMPAGVSGPPQHRHPMHDGTFLVTAGTLRFTLGETHRDAGVGDYVVVPIGAPHTFANVSAAPVEFFSTFTPAFYVNYFREMARLNAFPMPAS